MKELMENHRGSIAVNVYIIGLIIFTVLISTLTIQVKDFAMVQSNSNGIKAYFLAEAAMEEAYHDLDGLTHKAVLLYLEDLKMYKIDFINKMKAGTLTKEAFKPPLLEDYLQQEVIAKVDTLNAVVENAFEDYFQTHYYSRVFTYISDQNLIEIYTTGGYNQAKRYIRAEVQLPMQSQNGKDQYHLPKVKISSLRINSFYQTH